MTARARVRELLLAGYSREEIVEMVPAVEPTTVRYYCRRIAQELTPEQRERIAAAQARRPAKAAPPKVFARRETLSPIHARIGRKLAHTRIHRDDLGIAEFCKHHGFSNQFSLSKMEQGFYDFQLSEVLRIAEILETTVDDLLTSQFGAEDASDPDEGVLQSATHSPPTTEKSPAKRPNRPAHSDGEPRKRRVSGQRSDPKLPAALH